MRLKLASLLALAATAFAQVEPYEGRSLFEVLADNPSLLAALAVIVVLILVVLYLLFPMKKKPR